MRFIHTCSPSNSTRFQLTNYCFYGTCWVKYSGIVYPHIQLAFMTYVTHANRMIILFMVLIFLILLGDCKLTRFDPIATLHCMIDDPGCKYDSECSEPSWKCCSGPCNYKECLPSTESPSVTQSTRARSRPQPETRMGGDNELPSVPGDQPDMGMGSSSGNKLPPIPPNGM